MPRSSVRVADNLKKNVNRFVWVTVCRKKKILILVARIRSECSFDEKKCSRKKNKVVLSKMQLQL